MLIYSNKNIEDLTTQEKCECRNLSFRSNGWMKYSFNFKDTHIFLVRDENNKLIAWASLIQSDKTKFIENFELFRVANRGQNFFQVYVRKKYRRNGIGTRLYDLVKAYNQNDLSYYKYDTSSIYFFLKVNK